MRRRRLLVLVDGEANRHRAVPHVQGDVNHPLVSTTVGAVAHSCSTSTAGSTTRSDGPPACTVPVPGARQARCVQYSTVVREPLVLASGSQRLTIFCICS